MAFRVHEPLKIIHSMSVWEITSPPIPSRKPEYCRLDFSYWWRKDTEKYMRLACGLPLDGAPPERNASETPEGVEKRYMLEETPKLAKAERRFERSEAQIILPLAVGNGVSKRPRWFGPEVGVAPGGFAESILEIPLSMK